MRNACPVSRFVEIMEKSKCRKEPETSKIRERLVDILTNSTQFKVVVNLTRKENMYIFTNSLKMLFIILKTFIRKSISNKKM